ncbi:4-phosphopantetheinyl transferase [Halomonas sp. M4R5S39]|uniref:4'-phosphopantetheinyl transferase family protein n=1 Tax=Halomonas kalidii TaxID=3043293 RepID=UPI0024A810CC|nr:4'-phosphopantetheinyl transferase superfamily protein [Halomonas kalidii]MDI5985947.1 4-phosphopantetheinyl transferase [Halomonas kalidii]
MKAHLELILAQAPPGSSGARLSRLGRELLSRLAARRGLDCPLADWSPRGQGAPRHPSLPMPWRACLSHRDGRVVAGLATVPVGIDLEHARPRHGARLAELVDLLPEARVRRAILEAASPLGAFYRAWTLHEALFKLDSLSGRPPGSVLETRLSRLLPGGEVQAWQWQHSGWTLSICSHQRRLCIRSLPRLAIIPETVMG